MRLKLLSHSYRQINGGECKVSHSQTLLSQKNTKCAYPPRTTQLSYESSPHISQIETSYIYKAPTERFAGQYVHLALTTKLAFVGRSKQARLMCTLTLICQ